MNQAGSTKNHAAPKPPQVQTVDFADVTASLKQGWTDFLRAPKFGLFFGAFYTLGGLFILACLIVYDMPWMIIPVAIGFPLVGPFVAVGLYEVSRRLKEGRPLVWREILLVILQQRERQFGPMAFIVLFIFWIWIYQVRLLLALFFGFKPIGSLTDFANLVLTTADGAGFLAVGTIVGAFLAFILFSSTVISMPLLLDRDIDFVTAMITSFKAVFASPVPMLSWGIVVTFLAMLAMVPAFLGLLIVLPVLGHATWHLYERAIAPLE